MIGLDAGGGVLLALRERHLSQRMAAVWQRNADRLAPTMPEARLPSTDEAVASYDRDSLHRLAAGTGLDLAIVRGAEVLGAVTATLDEQGTAQLGCWVDTEVEGTGIAMQASITLAEHLVGRRGVSTLSARPDDRRGTSLARRLGLADRGSQIYACSATAWREAYPATGVELALPVDGELELVLVEPRSAAAMYAMTAANLERLRQWESWAHEPPDPAQTTAYWRDRMSAFARGEAYPLAARLRGASGPGLLGSLGATIEPELGIATVGYWLDESAVGRGVGSRSLHAVLRLLFEQRGLRHVGLSTAVDNARSRALAERCGFRFDRLLPRHSSVGGREVDCVAYVHRDSTT